MRLDKYLVEFKYFENIKEATSHILRANVLLDDKPQTKCGFTIKEKNPPEIRIRNIKKYVSRSAEKLKGFLSEVALNLNNSICFDLGSSTGGFTQVLLEYNIERVYCIDVGKNLLHKTVKDNNRVFLIENTNAKSLHINQFTNLGVYPDLFWKNRKVYSYMPKIEKEKNSIFITGDISFISLSEILPSFFDFSILAKNKKISFVLLIKPQFELLESEQKYLKKGVLYNTEIQKKTIERFLIFLENYNTFFQEKLNEKQLSLDNLELSKHYILEYENPFSFEIVNLQKSKLKGKGGNQEYIIHFQVSRSKKGYSEADCIKTFLSNI